MPRAAGGVMSSASWAPAAARQPAAGSDRQGGHSSGPDKGPFATQFPLSLEFNSLLTATVPPAPHPSSPACPLPPVPRCCASCCCYFPLPSSQQRGCRKCKIIQSICCSPATVAQKQHLGHQEAMNCQQLLRRYFAVTYYRNVRLKEALK